jgi:hypothetical protein
MRASAFWIPALFAALALGGCGNNQGTSGTAGTGGATTSSQGGSGGTGGTGGGGTAGSGGTGGGVTGGPFSSEGTSSYETQTSIAADKQGNVAAVWIAFNADNTSSIGYALSHDGGGHWSAPKTISSPGGRLASNPVVAVDSKARFTLAWLGFRIDANKPDEHVYVSRTFDQTDTFSSPLNASDDDNAATYDLDKPELKVDASDALLLSWADFTGSAQGTPPSLKFAHSADGQSFQRVTVTADNTFGNLASLCLDASVGPSATLYMVHLGANGAIALRTSVNQGQSWELRPTPATQAVFQDITCAVHGSDLWVAYAAGAAKFDPTHDSPGDSVQIMHSPDAGQTFDPPVVVSDGAPTDQYLFPQLARGPNGKLGIVYYQGAVGSPAKLVLASSTDGKKWGTSPVAMPGTFTVDRTIASWLGAYIGFAIPVDKGLVTYADNSKNKAHVQFAQIALP